MTWQAQLEMLQAALSHDPTNPLAWRWRVRVKVLCYLVSRYGEQSNLVLPPLERETKKRIELPDLVFLPYDAMPYHRVAYNRKRLREIERINGAISR